MIAAASDRAGTFHEGANLPARPDAVSAPSTIPKSMTEVTSLKTLACSSPARACQYGHDATSAPVAATIFDPHNANAEVTPHGRPASASVATLTAARPSAPAANGHGPRNHERSLRRCVPDEAGRVRRSMTSENTAMAPNSDRLIARAAHGP